MSGRSRREALRAERERQAATARRRDNVLRIGIAVVVALVIVAIAGIVQWQRSRVDAGAAAPAGVVQGYVKPGASASPAGMGNGIGVGEENAPVVVELFEDFSCPHCRDLEAGAHRLVDDEVRSGNIRVVYYPVTLSQFGRSTELAANAYACAADEGKGQQLHDALYADFNQEWTTDGLVELGRSVGLTSDSFGSCVRDDTFAEWVRSIDQTGTNRGVTGTPTVVVDGGKPLAPEDTTPTGLRLAIEAALAPDR
jgi:protein-disulfide isomerase